MLNLTVKAKIAIASAVGFLLIVMVAIIIINPFNDASNVGTETESETSTIVDNPSEVVSDTLETESESASDMNSDISTEDAILVEEESETESVVESEVETESVVTPSEEPVVPEEPTTPEPSEEPVVTYGEVVRSEVLDSFTFVSETENMDYVKSVNSEVKALIKTIYEDDNANNTYVESILNAAKNTYLIAATDNAAAINGIDKMGIWRINYYNYAEINAHYEKDETIKTYTRIYIGSIYSNPNKQVQAIIDNMPSLNTNDLTPRQHYALGIAYKLYTLSLPSLENYETTLVYFERQALIEENSEISDKVPMGVIDVKNYYHANKQKASTLLEEYAN